MKREILFKGLKDDMSNCNWVYGQLVYDAIGQPRITEVDSSGKGLTFHTCIKGTECQFTGKLDVNKNKIFENDIVQYSENPLNKVIVVWNKRTCGFVLNTPNYKNEFTRISGLGKLKVISNIHDK